MPAEVAKRRPRRPSQNKRSNVKFRVTVGPRTPTARRSFCNKLNKRWMLCQKLTRAKRLSEFYIVYLFQSYPVRQACLRLRKKHIPRYTVHQLVERCESRKGRSQLAVAR